MLALLLAAAAGVGAWWFGDARYTSTPGVIGLTQSAAEHKLEDAGLQVQYADEAYSETISAGKVIDTDPAAGTRILDGGTVEVTVSLGKERYDVPRMRGLTEDAAQDALTALKLSFNKSVPKFSETVPAGTVLGSDPKAGTTLRPGAAVDLFVSMGPRPIKIRDFTGQDAGDAKQVLEGKGLVVDDDQEAFSDTILAGNVISQSPHGGTLFRGETVTLVVSKGPELIEVPNVKASGVDSATQELESLGFVVRVENAEGYLGLGYVFRTDPGSGDMVPRGSTITLYLI